MTRQEKIDILVEHRELKCVGEDLYEDLGGHIVHESDKVIDVYYENFIDSIREFHEDCDCLKKEYLTD